LCFIISGAIALLSSNRYVQLGKSFLSPKAPVEFIIKELGKGILSGRPDLMHWMKNTLVLTV